MDGNCPGGNCPFTDLIYLTNSYFREVLFSIVSIMVSRSTARFNIEDDSYINGMLINYDMGNTKKCISNSIAMFI